MKIKGKKYGSWFMLLLVLGALLPACGTDSPTGQVTQTQAGVTTVGTATAGLATCTGCHGPTTAEWMLTRHANVYPVGNLFSQGNPTLGQIAGCTTACHDPQGDSAQLIPGYTGNQPRPVVGCEACHSGGKGHADSGGAGPIGLATQNAAVIGTTSSLAVSGQFLTCTGCHELVDPADPVNTAATATHNALSSQTPAGNQYVITDTHFAISSVFLATGTVDTFTMGTTINGYAMDKNGPTVCTNCHNPHRTADINRDWAQSGHANRTMPGPWSRYNMSCDGTVRLTCGPSSTYPPDAAHPVNDRRLCQRCHTTTGFMAFADALAAGDADLAGGLEAGTASQFPFSTTYYPQMLQCFGCHTDNKGSMRNPGAFKASHYYRVTNVGAPSGTMSGIEADGTFQYPDVGPSNVCVLCHTGRTNGRSIHNLNTDPTNPVDFRNLLGTDAHDFPSAAVMFKGLGYEYAGRNYADPSSYRHSQIGSSAVPNTGTSGPCVGCHMYQTGAPARHLFTAVSKSGSTIVNVMSEVCYNCHAGSSAALTAVLNSESSMYEDAKSALTYMLTAGTNTFVGMRNLSNWLSPGDADPSGNTTGKNNLGAYFNSRSLGNEDGGYIHNSRYVKRLIYDSIDWLDDNQLNYSTGSTLSTACTGTPPAWCAGAMSYILPNGTTPFAPAERP